MPRPPPPPKMSHSFTQNRYWIILQAPQHEGRKTCVKNGRQNQFFRHLKQFDGLAQLTPTA